MRLRPARPADAAPAAALLRASIAELCAADHGGDRARIAAWCANKTPEDVARWIAHPGGLVLVAEAEGALLGVASAGRAEAAVLLNYVAPAARFRGVSTALLAALEAALAAEGHARARLESTRTALAFYRARGWTDAGPPTVKFGLPSQPMTKRLARDIKPNG